MNSVSLLGVLVDQIVTANKAIPHDEKTRRANLLRRHGKRLCSSNKIVAVKDPISLALYTERKRLKYNVGQMANIFNVSVKTYSNWEKGVFAKDTPNYRQILMFMDSHCNFYKIFAPHLLGV